MFLKLAYIFILVDSFSLGLGRGDYGSCACSGLATLGTHKLYRDACYEAIRKCGDGKCDCFQNCQSGSRVIRIWRGSEGWTCKVRCGSGTFQCPAPPGGIGDPHLTGFDGSQFDFHGIDKGRYLILRKTGDSALVAQMRARSWTGKERGVVKTFFHKFGLVGPGGAARVLITFVNGSGGDMKPVLEVNGNVVENNVTVMGIRAVVKDSGSTILVASKGIEYSFFAKVMHGRNYHFDFSLKIKIDVKSPELFSGLLGDTVLLKNETVISSGHSEIDGYVNFEMSRRHMYAVDSLFDDCDSDM